MFISRRHILAGGLAAVPTFTGLAVQAGTRRATDIDHQLAELERRHPGRLCVSILDLGSGKRAGHRADERILLCSTFKLLAASFILQRVDGGHEQLDRRVVFQKSEVVDGSPVTGARFGSPGMTMAELCEAAITYSDNTAGNQMLASFGGPAALTAFCRTLGDATTRLDRTEPTLNYHDGPDDQRDTTTAAAMVENLRKLLFTDALSDHGRAQLAAWLILNKTGDTRLRAGLPKGWLVGDKTGTNGDRYGNANDVAVIWPVDRAPIIVAAYCEIPGIPAADRNAVIAEIGRIASLS